MFIRLYEQMSTCIMLYTTNMNVKKYSDKMYCFSPPVMLFTFLFEFSAAFYLLWRYKMSTTVRLSVAMLFALGTFQLAEYMICGGLGLHGEQWARLGYVSITLLPAIGIHLIMSLAGKKVPILLFAAYGTMAAFAAYFALMPGAINAQECRPNYAVFDMSHMSVTLYATYYYGWLVAGVLLTLLWSKDKKVATPLIGLCVGYLLFMIPTVTVNLIDPETMGGIPSIMCGFAVLLAINIVTFVLPKSSEHIRNSLKHKVEKSPS